MSGTRIGLLRRLLLVLIASLWLLPRFPLPGSISGGESWRLHEAAIPVLVLTSAPLIMQRFGDKKPSKAAFAAACGLSVSYCFAGILAPQYDLLRGLAFLVRWWELLALLVVLPTTLGACPRLHAWALRVSVVALLSNWAWVCVQYLGLVEHGTLWSVIGGGPTLTSSYGPALVGEHATFSAGVMGVLGAGIGLYMVEVRGRTSTRMVGAVLSLSSILVLILVESRAGLVAALVAIGMLSLLRSASAGSKGRWPVVGLGISMLLLGVHVLQNASRPGLAARFTEEGVKASLQVRSEEVFSVVLSAWGERPVLGLGPGSLGTDGLPEEAHNMLLRVGAEYGVVGLVLVVTALVAVVRNLGRDRRTDALLVFTVSALVVTSLVQDSMHAVFPAHSFALALGLCARRPAGDRAIGPSGSESTGQYGRAAPLSAGQT